MEFKMDPVKRVQQHRYTIEEFVVENKDAIKESGGIHAFLCTEDGIMDFIDNCVGKFPKGTYWQPTSYSIELVSRNRSKYDPDFDERVDIEFDSTCCFPIRYYSGCTETQEKFAKRLQRKFLRLKKVYDKIVTYGEPVEE